MHKTIANEVRRWYSCLVNNRNLHWKNGMRMPLKPSVFHSEWTQYWEYFTN